VVKVDQHVLFILEQSLAGKVEHLKNGILIADTYFVRDLQTKSQALHLKTEMRNDSVNTFHYFGKSSISEARVNGQIKSLTKGSALNEASFSFTQPPEEPMAIEWKGDWKIKTDTLEKEVKAADAEWMNLKKPISLEEADLLEHGYIWYRSEFKLAGASKELQLIYSGNDNDRQYIYVNGKLVWCGITDKVTIDIHEVAKKGKNVVAILYENFYHNKSHPHEGDLQKYSGIMQPVLIVKPGKKLKTLAKISSFKVRQHLTGVLAGYAEISYDDSKWQSVKAGQKYIYSVRSWGISSGCVENLPSIENQNGRWA
jgi:hypothetical protein